MIDTHSHIYSEEFDIDLDEVIRRAKSVGVQHIILPNVDAESVVRLHQTERKHQGYCHAAMGLHPTSVDGGYEKSLAIIEKHLKSRPYIAIGEVGIDLYWDKTYLREQISAFEQQIEWALEYEYPIIIHTRDSHDEVISCLKKYADTGITGIFHSFTGTIEQAREMLSFKNFKLGINGVVTFKNSGLDKVVSQLNLENIVIETDAPYLTPTPYRGKRNETAYIELVAKKISEIFNVSLQEVDEITTKNAKSVFKHIFK